MECIEAKALKPSFLVKANSQPFHNDEVWCLAGINSVSSDDFPVEDLLNLDFPQKDVCFSHQDDEQKLAFPTDFNHSSSAFSAAADFDSSSAAELVVPIDDVENLEWLSQFVDDSALEHSFSLLCPTASLNGSGGVHRGLLVEQLSRPVHKKPRSKRSRPQGRPWPVPMATSPPSAAESSSVSSSNISSALPLLLLTKLAAEKQGRKPEGGGSASGRRCAHCQIQKTPQWRTGPLGPKTLCNACGVRFKSGRLFPEYRPACSPTFSQELHSNSHRKVLEMRRKRVASEGG
ncbi:hypothetical protein C2S51_022340 [Perilla frutescens var. frutescens]|nr:hypothetical protein C2S51_022340 [Perilla frutescens var. frutescens]